jgi:hypothetical protein
MSKLWKLSRDYRSMSGRIAQSRGVARDQLPGATPSALLVALLARSGGI